MENSKSFHRGEIVSIILTLLVACVVLVHIYRAHQDDVVLAQKILIINQHVLALEKKVEQTAK